MIDLQDVLKGHPKRVDFISIYVEAWYTKKPSLERGGHRTKRDIHTYGKTNGHAALYRTVSAHFGLQGTRECVHAPNIFKLCVQP